MSLGVDLLTDIACFLGNVGDILCLHHRQRQSDIAANSDCRVTSRAHTLASMKADYPCMHEVLETMFSGVPIAPLHGTSTRKQLAFCWTRFRPCLMTCQHKCIVIVMSSTVLQDICPLWCHLPTFTWPLKSSFSACLGSRLAKVQALFTCNMDCCAAARAQGGHHRKELSSGSQPGMEHQP